MTDLKTFIVTRNVVRYIKLLEEETQPDKHVMAPARIARSRIYSPAILQRALKDAANALPEAKRTPSLMACLAVKILTLAADGQENLVDIRRIAVERMLESCADCQACDGRHSSRNGGGSSAS